MANIYEDLDKTTNEIRLLRIFSNPDPDAIVEVEVFKRDLKTAIEDTFIPFSYTWGDPAQQESIIVNSQTKTVRKNLVAMLKTARNVILQTPLKNDPRKHGYLFWADALCINQGDTDERNHQVSLMKDIYGSARLAVTYLGEVPEYEKAIKLMSAIHLQWYRTWTEFQHVATPICDVVDPDFGDWMSKFPKFWKYDDADDCLGNSYLSALFKLFTCTYWDRVWTFQETLLPQKIVIMIGSTVFDLELALTATYWFYLVRCMDTHSLACVDDKLCDVMYRALSRMIAHLTTIRSTKAGVMEADLTYLDHTRHLKATEPCDHIFGLLGIIDTEIAPDYSLTTTEVYRRVALAWWRELKDTNFLQWGGLGSQSSFQEEGTSRPTWTFDLETMLDGMLRIEDHFVAGMHLDCPAVSFDKSAGAVLVPGILFDEVVVASRLSSERDDVFEDLLEWAAARIAQSGMMLRATNVSIFQAIFSILHLGCRILPQQSTQPDVDDASILESATCFSTLLLIAHGERDQELSLDALNDRAQRSLDRLRLSTRVDLVRACIGNSLREDHDVAAFVNGWAASWDSEEIRRKHRFPLQAQWETTKDLRTDKVLFITKSEYLGVTGNNGAVAVTDRLAIIAKCDVPIILRGQERFKVVAPAYVPGLMEGEVGGEGVRALELE